MFNVSGRTCLIWGVLSCRLPGWTEEIAVRIPGVLRTFRIKCRNASHLTVPFGVRPNDQTLFAHCEDHLNAQYVTVALSLGCPSHRLPSAVEELRSVPQCPIFTTCTLCTHSVPYFCFVVSCSYRHRTKRRLLAHVSLLRIYTLVRCAIHGVCLYKLEIADGWYCVEGEWLFRCSWEDDIIVHLSCLIRTFHFLYNDGAVGKLHWRQVAGAGAV